MREVERVERCTHGRELGEEQRSVAIGAAARDVEQFAHEAECSILAAVAGSHERTYGERGHE